jgi:Asp-tRNA(Asn)/Glu-tRNA(Gln) amidotransferase A subunit family amidase
MPGMTFRDYLQRDAVGLAECVARKETTAAELLELALQRHAAAQPRTNAICRLMESEARSQLSKPLAGPFAGVPFLIKDCAQDYAGLPTTYASRSMQKIVAREHSHVVRRYIEAGLVIFGKTNLPEFALKGVTDSHIFGRAQNPWNVDHTPGGSSGGAAAAVASGVVPMAAGNDGGGSIRIPAACCGLFGLRPSRGRYFTRTELWRILVRRLQRRRDLPKRARHRGRFGRCLRRRNGRSVCARKAQRALCAALGARSRAAAHRLHLGVSDRNGRSLRSCGCGQ